MHNAWSMWEKMRPLMGARWACLAKSTNKEKKRRRIRKAKTPLWKRVRNWTAWKRRCPNLSLSLLLAFLSVTE